MTSIIQWRIKKLKSPSLCTHLVSLSDTDFGLNTSNIHKVIIKEIYTYTCAYLSLICCLSWLIPSTSCIDTNITKNYLLFSLKFLRGSEGESKRKLLLHSFLLEIDILMPPLAVKFLFRLLHEWDFWS